MKKLLISFGALLVSTGVFCEETQVTSEKKVSFDGFYLGGGLGMNCVRYNSYRLGVGGSLVNALSVGAVVNYDEQKVNRPMLSVTFGYGKSFYKNIYIGADCLVDIAPNKTKSVLIDGKEITEVAHDSDGGYVKYKGFSIQAGVRFGYIFDQVKTMVYIKPAASFLNEIELWNDSRRNFTGPDGKLEGNPKKVAFALAFGTETKVNDAFSVRFEAERLFKRSFTGSSFEAHGGTDTGWRTKANADAYSVRLMGVYNFR